MGAGNTSDMLQILTWNSNTGFDKMPSKDVPAFAPDVNSSLISCSSVPSKRKCSFDTPIVPHIEKHAVKALPADEVILPLDAKLTNPQLTTTCSTHVDMSNPFVQPAVEVKNETKKPVTTLEPMSQEAVKSREDAQLATMRQTISSQLSLEILLKHRELRLIDQELAKCQVALEQLRRCSEIPFPGLHTPSEQVSSGKGAAIRKSQDKRTARSPAPWGVMDGPYTRHYAKWLLHDPHFDGGDSESVMPTTIGSTPFTGRSTRGHFTDFAQMVGKTSRSQRALNHAFLPNGFAEPKQKPTGPMILKRKSDGKMVKLVCPDCGRHDFGSAQGFINHCRIGHQRNYASHDAAAEGCGQPLEADENGPVKETTSESQPQTPITVPPTPLVLSAAGSSIQPLVRSAHLIPKDNAAQPLLRGGFMTKTQRRSKKVKTTASTQPQCASAPHLSAFIQAQGMDVNLKSLVEDVKSKPVIDDSMDYEDDEMECESPITPLDGSSRHPGHKKPLKSSGKSIKSHGRRETGNSISSLNTSRSESQLHGLMGLLPSPTNESTQAPSLIDDDEEMDPQSPPSSDELDEADVHFHIRDDDHPEEGHELRGAEIPAPAATCTTGPTPVPSTLPSTTPVARPMSARKETQVQFIVEHPNRDNQGDRKRRKIGE